MIGNLDFALAIVTPSLGGVVSAPSGMQFYGFTGHVEVAELVGKMDIPGLGTFDITHGTTLQLDIPTQMVEFELSVDGMPVGPGSAHRRLELVNLDTLEQVLYVEDDRQRRTFAPGRYELRYEGKFEEQPDNAILPETGDVVMGCVTIEN